MPECLVPLLGRDLLSKLEAQIVFKDGEIPLLVPETKAIKGRTFMLQGTPEPDNSGGIPRSSSKCSNIPGLSQWNSRLFQTSSACKCYPKNWIKTSKAEIASFKIRR